MTSTSSGYPGRNNLEIRVHGIGDHDRFSALDGPTFIKMDEHSQVWTEGPPEVPDNKLRLINWSRANRKLTRNILWYLAFPFTMINVAGYMEPPATQHARFLRVTAFLVGLCMTLSMAVWVSVILETALRWVVQAPDGWFTRLALSVTVPLVLAYAVFRRIRRGQPGIDAPDTTLSIVTIVSLAVLAVALYMKPARLHYPNSERPVDVMALFVIATTFVALVAALMLAGSACVTRYAHRDRKGWSSKDGASFAGAALLCLMAIAVLHTAGSILRLVTSSVADFFLDSNRQVAVSHMLLFQPAHEAPGEFVQWASPLRIDLLPIFLAELVFLFYLCLRLMFRISLSHAKSREALRARRAELDYGDVAPDRTRRKPMARWHDLLSDIGTILPIAVLATALLMCIVWPLTALGLFYLIPTPALDWLVNLLKLGGVIVVAFLLIRRPEVWGDKLRKFFGKIGDIAGFWSPDIHPLAGRSYRTFVLDGIQGTINDEHNPNEPIALVGHSQGSVVAAWFVATEHWKCQALSDRERADRWAADETPAQADGQLSDNHGTGQATLVTCGCPLDTLYATFFPRFFNPGFFRKTRDASRGTQWLNYWRRTDAIASPLPCATNHNVTESIDVPDTLGHSKYFTDPKLRDAVDSILSRRVSSGGSTL